MDQSEISELISAYLDGEATPAEREEVEQLLETSPHWRSKLDQFARLSDLMRDVPRQSAPLRLAAAVQQRLSQVAKVQPAAVPARSLRREWLAGLAGMAVTLLGGFIALQVVNSNRSAEEHFASTQLETIALTENAASRSKFRIEAKPPVSVAFSAPEVTAREAEALVQENRLQSVSANSDQAEWSDAKGSQPPVNVPAIKMRGNDYFEQPDGYESVIVKPKDQLRIGDVLTVFERMDGVVFVVELTVVDMNEAGGQLDLLLAKNGLNVLPEGAADGQMLGVGVAAENSESQQIAKDGRAPNGAPQLKLMYVTAPRVTISQLLDELGQQQVVSQARLQPPVPAAPQTEAVEKLAELADRDSDQPATPEQAEEALVNEAVVVGQNYGLTQQVAPTTTKPVHDYSTMLKESGRKKTEQKVRIADVESKNRRFGKADKKTNDVGVASTEASILSRNSLSQLYLSNSAVPMTMNPQTGEVTNQFFYAKSVRSMGKTSSRSFEVNTEPAAAKSRFLGDAVKADESAPADAAVAAGTQLGEPEAEPPIRVLFVVKQADAGVSP